MDACLMSWASSPRETREAAWDGTPVTQRSERDIGGCLVSFAKWSQRHPSRAAAGKGRRRSRVSTGRNASPGQVDRAAGAAAAGFSRGPGFVRDGRGAGAGGGAGCLGIYSFTLAFPQKPKSLKTFEEPRRHGHTEPYSSLTGTQLNWLPFLMCLW